MAQCELGMSYATNNDRVYNVDSFLAARLIINSFNSLAVFTFVFILYIVNRHHLIAFSESSDFLAA
jgi:hypothetical protein